MDINSLVKKALTKDRRAFNLLFDLHWDYVYGYLVKKTANTTLSEEIALKCFSKAFDKINQFDLQANFASWLVSIAHHQWIDHLRQSQSKKAQMVESVEEVPEYSSPHLGPEDAMIANQKWEKLLACIQALTPAYRQLIQLRYMEGLSYQKIAAMQQEPLNTVKVKLFRAKKILAEKLAL